MSARYGGLMDVELIERRLQAAKADYEVRYGQAAKKR